MMKLILRLVVAGGLLTGALYAPPPAFNSKQECHAFCVEGKQLRFENCQSLPNGPKQDCLKVAQEDFQACLDFCDSVFP